MISNMFTEEYTGKPVHFVPCRASKATIVCRGGSSRGGVGLAGAHGDKFVSLQPQHLIPAKLAVLIDKGPT